MILFLNSDVPLLEQMLKFWQFNLDECQDSQPEMYWTEYERKLGDTIIKEHTNGEEFGCLMISDRFGQDDKTPNPKTFQKHHEKSQYKYHFEVG